MFVLAWHLPQSLHDSCLSPFSHHQDELKHGFLAYYHYGLCIPQLTSLGARWLDSSADDCSRTHHPSLQSLRDWDKKTNKQTIKNLQTRWQTREKNYGQIFTTPENLLFAHIQWALEKMHRLGELLWQWLHMPCHHPFYSSDTTENGPWENLGTGGSLFLRGHKSSTVSCLLTPYKKGTWTHPDI